MTPDDYLEQRDKHPAGLNQQALNANQANTESATLRDRTEFEILREKSQEVLSQLVRLRRENELMRARLDVFDAMMLVVRVHIPAYGAIYQPDIAQGLQDFLDKTAPPPSDPGPQPKKRQIDPDSLI